MFHKLTTGIVRPAKTDGFGSGTWSLRDDDGVALDLGGGVVELLVFTGDGEALQLAVFGFQPLANVLELDDRLAAARK